MTTPPMGPMSAADRGYLLMLAMPAIYTAVWLSYWVVAAIPFRYALDYNEGIVWQQMIDIVAGRGYGPIDGFPAIVFHYPPVYHLLMAGVAGLGVDPLAAGRIVSLLATLGSAAIIASLVQDWLTDGFSRMQRIAASGAAVFCFLGCEGVNYWIPTVRVDPVACFFALLGLWLAVRAVDRPALIYAAAVALVLSVFSKQNSVLSAVAVFGALLWWRPALAIRGIAICVVVGSAALALLLWASDGEALKHLVLYNINRFDIARLLPNLMWGTTVSDRFLLALGFGGVVWALLKGGLRANDRVALGDRHMVARYATILFALLTTVSLISSAKYGASSAYYMQWEAALAVFGGLAVACLIRTAQRFWTEGRKAAAIALASVPALLACWTALTTGPSLLYQLTIYQEQGDRLTALIQPVKGPILSTEMVVLLRDGRPVVWEPAIFRELAVAGRWDESVLVDKIRRHEIAGVISDGLRGGGWFDDQFSPAIADAMDEALPQKIPVGHRFLHLPARSDGDAVTRTPTDAAPQTSQGASPSGTE